MNTFDTLPKELWIHIISTIPCKYINSICNISKQFKELCVQENLFHKQKMKGYPRQSGHFKYHNVTEYEGYLYNKYKILMKCNFSNIFRNRRNKKDIKNISSSLLDVLYEDHIDLVCGDIIDVGLVSEEFIFDGETVINLKKNHNNTIRNNYYITPDEYYHIPNDLCPIKNNVPVKYWNKNGLGDITFSIQIANIKNELIKNISLNNYNVSYTWFTLNELTYVIYHRKPNLLTVDKLHMKDNIILYLTLNHINPEMFTFDIKDKIITNKYHIASRFY